jgi:hypothetical protein
VCYGDPSRLRATLTDRDNAWVDDGVSILLDTYGTGDWLYEFFVNPLGVQGDRRWTRSFDVDESFDAVFHAEGLITDSAYQVEIALPFSSLRFPHVEEQNWRVNFWRNLPRESNYSFYWSSIARDEPCFPCQFGGLNGLRGLKSSSPIELLPSLIGYQSAELSNIEDPKSGLHNDNPDGEMSLGARHAINSSISAEATINPDFSQVESDEGQIDVNSTFALFFPERRPFFQEGGDLYNTWIHTVYTRSINNPSFAAKLTGRLDKMSVGLISAIDETTPLVMPFEEFSGLVSLRRSVSSIARAQYNYGQVSNAGLLITDRRIIDGGSGSTISADGVVQLPSSWRLNWQGVYSYTEEPDDSSLTSRYNGATFDQGTNTVDFDGETFDGYAAIVSLERHTRLFDVTINSRALSPTFRADNGFVTQNSSKEINGTAWLNVRNSDQIIQLFSPRIHTGKLWNWDGLRKNEWIYPHVDLRFKGQYTFHVGGYWSRERYRQIDFDRQQSLDFFVTGEGSDLFRWGIGYERDWNFIARNLAMPTEGHGVNFSASAAIFPIERLVVRPLFLYNYLDRSDNEQPIFRAALFRASVNYQFTRELFLRLIVQYAKEDTYDQNDPNIVDRYKSLSFEPLLTYRVNPFTLFYVGSTHGFEDFNFNEPWRSRGSLTPTSRQFFIKLQYLINT